MYRSKLKLEIYGKVQIVREKKGKVFIRLPTYSFKRSKCELTFQFDIFKIKLIIGVSQIENYVEIDAKNVTMPYNVSGTTSVSKPNIF